MFVIFSGISWREVELALMAGVRKNDWADEKKSRFGVTNRGAGASYSKNNFTNR